MYLKNGIVSTIMILMTGKINYDVKLQNLHQALFNYTFD